MICGICGRVLRNPKSRKMGYGPVCYKKMYGSPPPREKASKTKHSDGIEDFREHSISGQMEISDFLQSK